MTKPNLPPGVPEMIEGEKVLWGGFIYSGRLIALTSTRGGATLTSWFNYELPNGEYEWLSQCNASQATYPLLVDLQAANARADKAEAERDHLQSVLDQIKHPHG